METFARRSTREQTPQRILAKADELVRHFGMAKTTVADIAATLGMSPANIYKSSPSKNAIIEVVAEQGHAKLQRTIEAAIASSPGALTPIDRKLQLLFTANTEHWDCVRDFKKFLLQKITGIIEVDSQSGEFRISEVGATARVLVDCLAIVIEQPPLLTRTTSDQKRVHALVSFSNEQLF